MTATISPENATNKNVTWTSTNPTVATVSEGVVMGIAKGTAIIMVKTEDGAKTAFNGCKNLKTVTIKTTKFNKKSIGKNAFKGIYKKATFKCPKKQLKNYKKWIKKAGKIGLSNETGPPKKI